MSRHTNGPKTSFKVSGDVITSYAKLPLQICKDFEYGIVKLDNALNETQKFKIVFHFRRVMQSQVLILSDFFRYKICPKIQKMDTNFKPIKVSARYGGAMEIQSDWDVVLWAFTQIEAKRIQNQLLSEIKSEFGVIDNGGESLS